MGGLYSSHWEDALEWDCGMDHIICFFLSFSIPAASHVPCSPYDMLSLPAAPEQWGRLSTDSSFQTLRTNQLSLFISWKSPVFGSTIHSNDCFSLLYFLPLSSIAAVSPSNSETWRRLAPFTWCSFPSVSSVELVCVVAPRQQFPCHISTVHSWVPWFVHLQAVLTEKLWTTMKSRFSRFSYVHVQGCVRYH